MSWLSKFFNFSKPQRELYIVVYDTKQLTLSTPYLSRVKEAFARQKGFKTLSEHVRSVLCLPGDRETIINDIVDFRKVAIGNIERHYIFVVGHTFMFREHLGRVTFENNPEAIAAKFPGAAPHIMDMLVEHLPGHVLMRA